MILAPCSSAYGSGTDAQWVACCVRCAARAHATCLFCLLSAAWGAGGDYSRSTHAGPKGALAAAICNDRQGLIDAAMRGLRVGGHLSARMWCTLVSHSGVVAP
jgi:hypothetical protein